ncbi:phosphatase PAP2 family protein [Streptococcus pluranimalium]|uniref:phosphatase PAP2 family protein n=1 Tax=Streptococcus pluranimalium TaxID=82348 RepID=UPI0039EBA496
MKNYDVFYGKLLKTLDKYPRLTLAILGYNWLVTKLMYLLFPILLIFLFQENRRDFWKIFFVSGLAFLGVSLFRKLLNQPRPYETWDVVPIMSRKGKGESFPSRHVFSATMISMCFLSQFVWLGTLLLIVSLGLAVCRVLGGVHYPKDVIAGYLIGIFSGLVLFLC